MVKAARASLEQNLRMLDFFQQNKGLAEGKFVSIHGRAETEKKWHELTEVLNGVQGAVKTAAQWQIVWRDLKSRTSIKSRQRRKQVAATGNQPIVLAPLSELDLRVLEIVGSQYVEGSVECAESHPDELELQLALEAGMDNVLRLSPNVVSAVPEQSQQQQNEQRRVLQSQRRKRRISVADDSREQFAKIAKQQADAMTMIAESLKVQAEANRTQANALERFVTTFETYSASMQSIMEYVTAVSHIDTVG